MDALSSETLFLGLAFLVGVWFALLSILWFRLIARHPQKYEAMRSPHFFAPLGAWPTLRFLVRREHRWPGDRVLGVIADLALGVLALYLVGFVALIAITQGPE